MWVAWQNGRIFPLILLMYHSEYIPWNITLNPHIMLLKGLIEMSMVPVLQLLKIIH